MTAVASDSIIYSLENVRCAGCIAKIERALMAQVGVILARGNATTKRMQVVWDPALYSPDELIGEIESLGYRAHRFDASVTQTAERSLLPHLALAGFGMMNIMAISFAVWAGLATDMGSGSARFMHWISAALALPVVVYSGSVFVGPSLRALRAGQMTMDTPISLAIWITYLASIFEVWRGSHNVYFDAVVALIFFLLIGRVLEQMLHRRSGDAAENLRTLMQVQARRERSDGTLEDVSATLLLPGDLILVESGERIPVDAVLLNERAEIDESVLTGETTPRGIVGGDPAVAGGILMAGPVRMRVTHVGDDAQIAKITALIERAAAHRGTEQSLADRFARGYIPLVLGGGALGFLLWFFVLGASLSDAVMIAVAVLVVTCPCAAGLATPAVATRAVNLLMSAGVIVKSGDALERLGEVDSVIADKTGTLTRPRLHVSRGIDDVVIERAAALAKGSSHTLAKALCVGRNVIAADGLIEHPGRGIQAVDGARLGSAAFVGAQQNWDGPSLWFRDATGNITEFAFEEMPQAGLPKMIEALRTLNLPLSILSGDNQASVARFAKTHGIPSWQAAALPADKIDVLNERTDGSQKPLMLGDGINDAAALKSAYASISFDWATDVAQTASDIVLTRSDLALVPQAIQTARQARALIRQNLRFSAVYNLVTVPLALAGLLTPIVAAILMSSSSIIVMLNGLRLKKEGEQ